MANRPLHLRWIYVKNHATLFIALAVLVLAGVIAAIVLLDDPARGLAVGALPSMFVITAWTLTNNAGYVDRTHGSLPHERQLAAAKPLNPKPSTAPKTQQAPPPPAKPTQPSPQPAPPAPKPQSPPPPTKTQPKAT
ncbi:MAG: hypothetical protein OER12_06880, partial [Acidimicrobiia bacterium]|nr:hypothetical protein [Acidimicrobiia bacterium]